jgi:hypothetical protein
MATPQDDVCLTLLQLGEVIQQSISSFIKHKDQSGGPPPKELTDARRNLLASAGMLTELVSDPGARITELAFQFNESRALHIVADKRVADLLGPRGDEGMSAEELAMHTQMEQAKVCESSVFKAWSVGDSI